MRRIIITLAALAVIVSACTTAADPSPTTTALQSRSTTERTVGTPRAILASFALARFDQCEAFLDHVKAEAAEVVGPYGLDQYGGGYIVFDDVRALAVEEAAPQAAAGGDSSNFSGTNIQELGVDEADIVKTDGRRIIALARDELFVIDITGDAPTLAGRIRLENASVSNIFLSGDTVLTMGSTYGVRHFGVARDDMEFAPDRFGSPSVQLTEVDISGEPRIAARLDFDGAYVSSRMIDGSVRVVSGSGPNGFDWVYPEGSGLRAEREASEANRRLIEESTIDNWVPYSILSDAHGNVVAEGNLIDCDRALAPVEFAGFNMLSVTTIDLTKGLDVVDATGVLANGETVYASSDSLYVATQRWGVLRPIPVEGDRVAEVETATTEIHQFDISSPTRTEYVASGSVDGYLLNQFAMSEHDGDLRVASTTRPAWWGNDQESESFVTVLEPKSGELVTIGRVGGLGRGEQIFSVRFIGDTGYVVTFRQTDPLYTIDLSDPTEPKVVGELKILGYSAYLHPISDDLILGVGQDANEQGRVKGSQLSLFDVSDPAKPVRIDQLQLSDGGNSEVEYDHRAFLYWDDTVVIPVAEWDWHDEHQHIFMGAVAVKVGSDGLTEIGTINHPGGISNQGKWDGLAQIRRSIVVGDDLFTVSSKGVLQSDFADLAEEGWLNFG